MTAHAPTESAFGARVLTHLDAQLVSTRKLLDSVLRQGQAVRARDVDGVLGRLTEIQSEMDRRATLERERTAILQQAAGALGVPAHAVTLDDLAALLAPLEAHAARGASAELRGLLHEVQREHQVNRALMRQELAFLSHLTRMMGGGGDDTGYRPPSEPGAPMRQTLEPRAAALRVLDLEV